MYRYLFFDFDGTLYDTVEGITRCVQYALRKRGMDAPLDSLRCFAGPPLDDMFMEKFGFTREDAEQAVRDFRERYVPIGLYESRPFPGLKDLLRDLHAAGYRLAVTTSKPQVLAEELLRREDLHDLFDCICGAAEEVLPRLVSDGLRPDAVILDPPRKGADPAVLSAIAAASPERIVYVSCDPATLARDLKQLTASGYNVERVQPVDMFSWTAHIETAVRLTRKS